MVETYLSKGKPTAGVREAWRWGERGLCLEADKLEATLREMLENAAQHSMHWTLCWVVPSAVEETCK